MWLIFTFLGLFIFGIFPSITAAFDTYTKYSNNKKINIFQTFKNSYKNLFISSNIIGFIFSFILSIILIDYFYFLNITNVFSIIFSYVLLLIFLMFSFSLVFSLKLKANFIDSKITDIIKNGVFYSISYFIQIFITFILILAVILLAFKIIPGIIPILGISFILIIINYLFQSIIDKKSFLNFFKDFKTSIYQ